MVNQVVSIDHAYQAVLLSIICNKKTSVWSKFNYLLYDILQVQIDMIELQRRTFA